jgi:hypothetical protein
MGSGAQEAQSGLSVVSEPTGLAGSRLEEFYATADLSADDLADRLDDWQSQYNEFRVHSSLEGRTPWQVWHERAQRTPLFEEVEALYDESVERIRHPDYRMDLHVKKSALHSSEHD